MKRLRYDKTRLKYQQAFGSRGLVDLLVGIGFCAFALFAWRYSGPEKFIYGFGISGLFFFLRGLLGVTRVRGFTLDRLRGMACVWHGWLAPMFRQSYPLHRYDLVCVSTEVHRERGVKEVYYIVSLAEASSILILGQVKAYLDARRLAEDVAKFLGLGIMDAVGLPVTRIEAADIGKPLRDRQDIQAAPLEPPAHTRLHWEGLGERVVIRIPRPRFSEVVKTPLWTFLFLGGLGAVVGFGLGGLVSKTPFDWNEHIKPALIITLALGTFGLLVGLLLELETAFVRFEIEADPYRLQVRRQGLLFGKTHTLKADEVKELRFTHLLRLGVITDREVITIGNDDDLTGQDLEWVRATLTRTLANQSLDRQ
jgi:hypothetical protein